MSSLALLLFFLPLSAFSQYCGPFTDSDFEGPYFVDDADLEYATAPGDELADREQVAYLTGKVSCVNKEDDIKHDLAKILIRIVRVREMLM